MDRQLVYASELTSKEERMLCRYAWQYPLLFFLAALGPFTFYFLFGARPMDAPLPFIGLGFLIATVLSRYEFKYRIPNKSGWRIRFSSDTITFTKGILTKRFKTSSLKEIRLKIGTMYHRKGTGYSSPGLRFDEWTFYFLEGKFQVLFLSNLRAYSDFEDNVISKISSKNPPNADELGKMETQLAELETLQITKVGDFTAKALNYLGIPFEKRSSAFTGTTKYLIKPKNKSTCL